MKPSPQRRAHDSGPVVRPSGARRAEIGRALALGVAQHQQGRRDEAARLYDYVLGLDPEQADALHLRGVLAHEIGDHAQAARLITRAIAIDSTAAAFHANLGNVRQAEGDLKEAAACFGRALALNPALAEVHLNLGNTLHRLGQREDAAQSYREALAHQPALIYAHINLGVVQLEQGEYQAAVESCRRATQLAPGNANAWFNLGLAEEALGRDAEARATLERAAQLSPGFAPAQARLGTLLLKAEQWEDAAERFGRVLALAPEDFDGWCGLGSARRGQGRHEEALDCLEQAGRLRPNAPLLEFQIGLTLVDLGDIAGAAGRFARNIEHLPEFAPAHFNLGNAQRILRRFPEAEASYQRALALQPDYEAAHWNLGLTLLQEGKIADGWEEHEWRWRSALVAAKREWPQPMWDGVASDRTRILVWREQGIGDEIMFLSCFPDLRRAVGHIILTCTPKLRPLLQRSFPGVEIWDDMLMKDPAELDIDCHIPLGSLPRYFRPSVESFPSESGYLKAAPERVAFWTARLGELGPGLKVGISWRSRLMGKGRAETYSRVEDWGPILGVRGVQFISLQYDECGEELARASASAGVPIHRLDGIDLFNDLDDSAALDAALDLVIAPDNSVGELAAALGRPVWRVDNGSDWSTLGTPHRPWQPTMRLFSRPLGTPWQPVLEHIGAELEAWSLRQAAGLCESRSGEVHVQAA